jgi:hypothetical protein
MAFHDVFRYIRAAPDFCTSSNLEGLSNAILNIAHLPCDDSLFERLVGLIVANGKIVRPALIRILLDCFWPQRKAQAVTLLAELCRSHTSNAVTLHNAQIDVFLIGQLPDDGCLQLIKQIALVISSPAVVDRFIVLLVKTAVGQEFTNFIRNIIFESYRIPVATFDSDASVVLDSVSLAAPFSFTGWIFAESEYRFDLLSVGGISIYLENSLVNIGPIAVKSIVVPVQEWVLLTLCFADDQIIVLVNSTVSEHLTLRISGRGSLVFLPGGSGKGKAASFGIFPGLDRACVRSLHTKGPQWTDAPTVSHIAYFTPADVAEYRAAHRKMLEVMNLPNVLLKICGGDILLPLLAQPAPAGLTADETAGRLDAILALLAGALLIDDEQQQLSDENDEMGTIAHLLMTHHAQSISYHTYRHFLDLLHLSAREQIMRAVLLNFGLWSQSAVFVRVAEDWRMVLFVTSPEVREHLLPLPRLLDLMRVYLWYSVRELPVFPPDGPCNRSSKCPLACDSPARF